MLTTIDTEEMTTEKSIEIRNCIKLGAKELDALKPGWENIIDVNNFGIHSATNCLITQLFGDYRTDMLVTISDEMIPHPFANEDSEEVFYIEVWTKEIMSRRLQAA